MASVYYLSHVIHIFVFLVGTCVGSFLNVLIYRLPRGIQFIKGNSFCPSCGKKINSYDLIPVISFLFLRGACRTCKTRISIKYPIIEILTGGLALTVVYTFGFNSTALFYFLIFTILTAISFIDAEHMIIPDGLVIGLAFLSIVYVMLYSTGMADFRGRIIGFFVISLPMTLLTLLIEDAFGGGDIKLIAVCGFLLGYKLVLLAGFIAVMMGGCQGLYVKYIKKDVTAIHIAFGQYICIGVFIAILFGKELINLYFSMML